MRKFFARALFVAGVSSLILSAPALSIASGKGVAYVGDSKIGYVDFNRALNEVYDGENAKKRLRNEFKEKQQKLDRLQDELTSMKEAIDRDRLLLSSDVIKSKEKAYRQKLTDVQRRFAEFQLEMSEREAHLTEEILDRLKKIVKFIGDDEGYALILEKSQEIILYAPGAYDLTDRVIKQYNSGGSKKRR
ncbi:MAG: OmpH family outer membrane protein [Pseudomonadota bacterium]